ncbi:MAG: N-acetylmuramoyl-L-alanine amidase [Planctomycetes bacterium]|nr:N-acetylmuramoyl-L-alanine amidase [Planctomycetota bacterium]
MNYYKRKMPVRRRGSRRRRTTERRVKILCMCVFGVSLCFLIVSILLNFNLIRRFPGRLDLERICKTDIPESNWRYIIIHHSATDCGNAADFDRYHRKVRGWKYGLAYHFVIGNGHGSADGEIEVGERWRKQIHGAHTANMDYNRIAIGICIVGNLEEEMITTRQFDSLCQIVLYLSKRYNIPLSNLIMHNQVIQKKGTLCPGKNFPYDDLISKLSA